MKISLNKRVENFIASIGSACRKIEEAARQYVLAVRDYPRDAPIAFRKAIPQMSNSGWDKLFKIGSGGANPNIMWLSDIAANRILRLSIEEQDELFGDKGPRCSVVVVDKTTGIAHEKKVSSLKKKDLDVLIDDENRRIRTREEQESYVRKARRLNPKSTSALYRIEGNVLFVYRSGRITKQELISILKEMSK